MTKSVQEFRGLAADSRQVRPGFLFAALPGTKLNGARFIDDAVKRGVVEFEATDSRNLKIEYAYRLLVHDKKIVPLQIDQISLPSIKHRLAMWVSHQLPADHELLN